MDPLTITLLTISPLKVGLYCISDYIGTKLGSINIRVGALMISIIATIIYLILYGTMLHDKDSEYSIKQVPYLVCLTIGILLLTVFFLLNYYSVEDEKKYCEKVINLKVTDSLALVNTEKTLILFYFTLIFFYIYLFMKSFKKWRKGTLDQVIKIDWKFYLMVAITVGVFLLKCYQMKLLIKQKKLISN